VEFVQWLAEPTGTDASVCASIDEPRAERHLVLYFDINKTCIMSDRLAGKSEEAVVNEILANTSWGLQTADGWHLCTDEPIFLRPTNVDGQKYISYAEYIEIINPGRDKRKLRTSLTTCFTKEGHPGHRLAQMNADLVSKLRNPDGSFRLLIPSFFHLLVSLKKAKRSFALCFRTFGEDLLDVAEELNIFCEGRHPMFPGHRMDGTDGHPDYRLHLADQASWGTFHRTPECDSLVLGTTDQPGEGMYRDVKDRSISFYKTLEEDFTIISGRETCRKYLWDLHGRPGTSGFRDCFQFWKHCHNTSDGGKIFFFTPKRSTNRHEVFFDDNIRYEDAHIVQAVNVKRPDNRTWVVPLLQRHLCKVEPLQVIHDKDYFVKELQRLEEGYERHLQLLDRIQGILREFAKVHQEIKQSWSLRRRDRLASWYDCWSGLRREDHEAVTYSRR
jgi:hypothetical protein